MLIYDTGICSRCGSKWTGRIIEKRSDARSFALMGPVIYTSDPRGCNLGCAECGVMWIGPLKIKWIPFKQYASLWKEWWETVDGSPTYTREEEAAIAESMYNELVDREELPEQERFAIAKKILRHEKDSLGKQVSNTVSDFAGIMGLSLYKDEDEESNNDIKLSQEGESYEDNDVW